MVIQTYPEMDRAVAKYLIANPTGLWSHEMYALIKQNNAHSFHSIIPIARAGEIETKTGKKDHREIPQNTIKKLFNHEEKVKNVVRYSIRNLKNNKKLLIKGEKGFWQADPQKITELIAIANGGATKTPPKAELSNRDKLLESFRKLAESANRLAANANEVISLL
jgi:hypothetical protein